MKRAKIIPVVLAAILAASMPVSVMADDISSHQDTPSGIIIENAQDGGEDETPIPSDDATVPGEDENPSEPEIIEGEVDVTTMIDTYTKDGEEQSYTISSEYVTVDDAQSVTLTLEIPEGINVNSIDTGNWGAYENEVTITHDSLDYNTLIISLDADIIPVGTVMEGVTINATLEGDDVTLKGVYNIVYNDLLSYHAEFEETTERVEPECNLSALTVTGSPSTVDYLASTFISVNDIGFSGGIVPDNMVLSITVPERLFADKLTLPEFTDARYTVRINGNSINTDDEEVYLNTRINSFEITIIPSEDFSMDTGLMLELRNTLNNTGTDSVNVTLTAFDQDGNILDTVSETTRLGFSYVDVFPVIPDTPDQPSGGGSDTPVTPQPDPEDPGDVTPQPGNDDTTSDTPEIVPPESDITDNNTEEEEPVIIVDLTGHMLTSSTVSSQSTGLSPLATASNYDNGNRLNMSSSSSSNSSSSNRFSITPLLTEGTGSSSSTRIESTDIYEYEQDQSGTSYEVNRSDDSEDASVIEEEQAPEEEIEQSPVEEAVTAVAQSDYTPIILIVIIAAAALGVVLFLLLGRGKNKKGSNIANDSIETETDMDQDEADDAGTDKSEDSKE